MNPIAKPTLIKSSNVYLIIARIIVVLLLSLRLPLIAADEVILVADE